MSRSHDQTALFIKMMWSVPAFVLLLIVACQPQDEAAVSVPEEIEALQSLYERDARSREERLRLEEELAKASSEIATREAWKAEQNRLLDQREQLVTDQERLAARWAELERREKAVERLSDELESRGTAIAARETELQPQRESVRLAEELDRKPEAEAAQEAEPQWVETTLPLGTVIEVELMQTVSSRTAQPGDRFSSRVARDVYSQDGVLVVPSGSEMRGTVTSAKRLKRIGGQAQLGIEMDSLTLPSGHSVSVHASLFEVGTNQRKDKKKILGAAAAGAILGRILGNRGGAGSTAIGAALGAAAGTAVVASRRGQDVELMAGDIIAVRLDEVVTVETEMVGLAGS